MNIKKPATFHEQVELIKNKGFIIDDLDECEKLLRKVNYYRLSAYFLPFKKSDGTFLEKIHFSQIQKTYEFDSRIRSLVFEETEEVELFLRSNIAYFLSHKYGPLSYLDKGIFSKSQNFNKYRSKVDQCIRENRNSLVVKHHNSIYDGEFPIWVIIEFFSLGMLSRFWSDLNTVDKKILTAGLYHNVSSIELESWLNCLTILRNKCAHYSRLYYWSFSHIPRIPKARKLQPDRSLFLQIAMIGMLHPDKQRWRNKFCEGLKALVEQYSPDISLDNMGFPEDWYGILREL